MLFVNYVFSKRNIFVVSTISIILGLINLQGKQLVRLKAIQKEVDYLEEEQHLKAKVKFQQELPAFGFDNIIADWNFLQFIQYVGDYEARDATGYSVVTDYFQTGVKRDPNFVQSHLSMSSANSLFAAEPEKTIELLTKVSEKINPEAAYYPFFIWTYKATDEILFMGDLEAAKNSYNMAANWAELRQDKLGEELSQRYQTTAQFLATNPDPTRAQFGAWMNILSSAKDTRTQDYVIKNLKKLGAEVNISPNGEINVNPPKFDSAKT